MVWLHVAEIQKSQKVSAGHFYLLSYHVGGGAWGSVTRAPPNDQSVPCRDEGSPRRLSSDHADTQALSLPLSLSDANLKQKLTGLHVCKGHREEPSPTLPGGIIQGMPNPGWERGRRGIASGESKSGSQKKSRWRGFSGWLRPSAVSCKLYFLKEEFVRG